VSVSNATCCATEDCLCSGLAIILLMGYMDSKSPHLARQTSSCAYCCWQPYLEIVRGRGKGIMVLCRSKEASSFQREAVGRGHLHGLARVVSPPCKHAGTVDPTTQFSGIVLSLPQYFQDTRCPEDPPLSLCFHYHCAFYALCDAQFANVRSFDAYEQYQGAPCYPASLL
jgi:hypothetical protein